MTNNYEKIKAMSVEDMAEWLYNQYEFCNYDRCPDNCFKCKVNNLVEWLQQEAE